jgi:hypothetical protein
MSLAHHDAYTSFNGRRLAAAFAAWFVVAVAVVVSGRLARAPVEALPILIASLTAASTAALVWTHDGRALRARLSLPALIGFQAWRVVPGALFLVLYQRGELPGAFALTAGIGDIAVAIMAAFAARFVQSRAVLLAFTFIGILDLAIVVRTAYVVASADPVSMHLLREMPLGLLPTFAVPITLAAHALALGHLLFRKED